MLTNVLVATYTILLETVLLSLGCWKAIGYWQHSWKLHSLASCFLELFWRWTELERQWGGRTSNSPAMNETVFLDAPAGWNVHGLQFMPTRDAQLGSERRRKIEILWFAPRWPLAAPWLLSQGAVPECVGLEAPGIDVRKPQRAKTSCRPVCLSSNSGPVGVVCVFFSAPLAGVKWANGYFLDKNNRRKGER